MDCRTAQLLLPFAHQGRIELERADREALERHLADCADCRCEAEAERAVDRVLARAMRKVPIPAGLRERLLTKLTQERRRFYLRWAVRGCAAAAVLLVVFLFLYRAFPDKFDDLVYFRTPESGNYQVPLLESPPAPPSVGPFRSMNHMLEHLRALGCAVDLPTDLNDWDFRLLQFATVEEFRGKPTATLGFRKGTASAKVRLIAPGQHDPALIEGIRAAGDPQCRIVGSELKDRFLAIVELSGDARLEDFWRPRQTVA